MRITARRVLVIAAVPFAVVLGVEGALRLVGYVPHRGWSDVPLALAVAHPQRGYTLPPSTTVRYAGVTTLLGPLGLRGAPPGDAPTAVLALGDELTFGWGVADGRTWPEQLEAWLRGRCPSCGRVVNAGVPGYTSYQGLMLLRELGARLRPRVVVVAFHLNDALLDGGAPAVPDLHGLRRLSVAYGWVADWATRPAPGWWRVEPRTPLGRYQRDLRAMVAEARRIGAGAVLLSVGFGADLPDAPGDDGHRLRRGRFEGDYHGAMRQVVELDGAPLVEVIGPALDRGTMLDAVHPSAEGYRRIAAAVGERLAAEGFLDP